MLAYLHWQFIIAPRFLLITAWNLELALAQFFSVGTMLRTLFAHWHRDVAAYEKRSFGEIFVTFAMNQISRAIGFIIRSSVLLVWLLMQLLYLIIVIGVLLVFLAAPFLLALGFILGLRFLV